MSSTSLEAAALRAERLSGYDAKFEKKWDDLFSADPTFFSCEVCGVKHHKKLRCCMPIVGVCMPIAGGECRPRGRIGALLANGTRVAAEVERADEHVGVLQDLRCDR